MTQEEKARAYDAALERARELHDVGNALTKMQLGIVFPQLVESEDERIRKELISQVEKSRHHPADKARWLAYLEKQKENPKNAISIPADCASNARCPYKICGDEDFIGDIKDTPAYHFGFDEGVRSEREKQKEQKHPNGCFTCDEYKKGYEAGRSNGFTAGYNKAMKEQKPVEIHIDNPNIQKFDPDVKVTTSDSSADGKELLYVSNKSYNIGFRDGVNSVKQEWSEEDEKIITRLIGYFESFRIAGVATKWEGLDIQEVITLLKSLRPQGSKDSLQTHWKPSEEQMEALQNAVALAAGNKVLAGLYEHLLKSYRI